MRSTLLATFIALAAASSSSSFSDPSSSPSPSSSSSSPSPDVDDFKSHYLAYYAPFQLARLATFRASRGNNDSLTAAQDALLSRAESAVAAGNASEMAAVENLCLGTFGAAGCAVLAGVEDGTCDGGREQLLQRQRVYGRDQMKKRPLCTCTGYRELFVHETCFCMYRRANCVIITGGCGFFQAYNCVGRCAPKT